MVSQKMRWKSSAPWLRVTIPTMANRMIKIPRMITEKLKANETPPTHNNRSRGAGGVWEVAAVVYYARNETN
jgi:hypothetical protein